MKCFCCLYFESHRCRNKKTCPPGMSYVEYTGSTVRQCLEATTEIYQDGYIHCPILESVGCERCMERFGDGSGFEPDEDQNYERKPRWQKENGMRDCGLPKEVESQCCLNRGGMCTLDTADFGDIDRAVGMRGCGFIGVNDRYLLWKYGVPYKDLVCGSCGYFEAGEYSWGICTNETIKPHTKGFTENGEKKYTESKEYYNGANACGSFVKRGSEEVARKTKIEEKPCPHWKGSSGPAMLEMFIMCDDYKIVFKNEDDFHRLFENCNRNSTKCGPQHLRNVIKQLEQSFSDWEHLKEFGGQDPFWSDGSNMNLVRNHIIYHKEEVDALCSEFGIELPPAYNRETPPEVDTNYIARADEIRANALKSLKAYKSDENYLYLLSKVNVLDKKQQNSTCICNVINYVSGLDGAIKKDFLIDMRRHENPSRYMESFSECAEKVRAILGEVKTEECAEQKKVTACEESLTNTGSDSCASGTQEDIATSTVDKPTAMTARDSSGTEAESCANCQVNKDVCLAFQAAMSQGLRPEECLCDNWTMEEEETMKNENACPYGKLSCDCRCITSFDGQIVCDAIRRKDWDRYHYIKEMQPKVNCDIFDKLAAEIIAEKNGERLERQKNAAFLPENVTKTDEIVTFDYSIVDEETGAFLQEKAQRVTEIRFKSVLAMGREFKQAQEKLANNKTGVFQQWVKSIGFDPKTAYNYINGFDYIMENFHNIEDADSIQPSLLFAVSKPSARPELQQAVLAGDIKTHKEYKELEEKLREAEFHYDTVKKSYEQLEKVNSEHYRLRTEAEKEVQKLRSENRNTYEAYQKDLKSLNQQLDQAKRNSDPDKVRELGQLVSEKQREIESLRQQLKDKPIEATAARVVEKLPDDVQEYLSSVNDTMRHMQNFAKVNQVLNLIVGLSTDELQSWAMMMNNRKAVDDDEESETLELLGMAIQSLEDMKEDYESRGCE